MKKKFLGIAAVALLGIGAAFATTTSTIYFTTSGTLSKYEDVLDGVIQTDNDPSNGNRTHSSELAFGVSKVITTFEGSGQKVVGQYMGKEVTEDDSTNPLKVTYSRTGRVANPTSNKEYSLSNPPYIYREMYLENLKFCKAGDYYLIPVHFYGFIYDGSATYLNNLGVSYNKDIKNFVFTQPQTVTLSDNYTCTYLFLDRQIKSNDENNSVSKQNGCYTSAGGKTDYTWFLYIYVNQDFEGNYNTKFNNVLIKLIDFDSTASGVSVGYYFKA